MLTAIEVYKKIAPKLGDEEATAIINFIQESVEHGVATKADLLSTEAAIKAEIHEIARELETNFRKEIADVRKEVSDLRKEVFDAISNVRKEVSDLRKEVFDTISDVRKEVFDAISNVRKEVSDLRKDVSELRGLLIKYILPLSSLIGAIVGTIISILMK